jgi:hypothetical protein
VTAHELTSDENTSRRFQTSDEVQRRAAVYVAGAHLRGADAVTDRAAIVELLDILGIKDVAKP